MLISKILHDIYKFIISAIVFTAIDGVVAANATEPASAVSTAAKNIGNAIWRVCRFP